ncbi:MAG: hypothetical protein JNM17_04595 [Archangium sp.]|nr:hypothetical protein [Archangium sp.]
MTFAVAVAVVLSAAPPDAGTVAPFAWDVPGQTRIVPVGNQLERNGLPMVIYLANSTWELDALLLHYAARFTEAGYFIPPKMGRIPGLKLPRLVALDDTRMISFLVYGWPEPDGTTTLVLGAGDLAHRKPITTSTGLPLFPAAKNVTSFNIELATALSFSVKGSEAEVIDFYRSVLPSGGWKEREPGAFVKDGRVVRVLSKKTKTPGELSIVVLEQSDQAPVASPPVKE